mgnify:CR=1 FL=1
MKTHIRATAHLYVLAAAVAVALTVAFGCAGTGHGLARLGGAGGGAAIGAAVGGPLGAGVGAIAGDAGANLVIPPPPPPPATVVHNTGSGTVYTQTGAPGWSIPWWYWPVGILGALVAIPRTRPHVLGFLYSVAHAHPLAALAKAGATVGWVHSKRADNMLVTARASRRAKPPPAVVVSTEQKPHSS